MLKAHEIIGRYDKDSIQRLVCALGPEEHFSAVGPETREAVEELGMVIGATISNLLQRHQGCPACKLSQMAYSYLALGVMMAQEQAERARLTAEIGEPDGSA